MPSRCFLIYNPTSGSFSQRKIDSIVATLMKNGIDPVLMPTGSALDAPLFAARICAENKDPLIMVAGGDGTINGVINGLVPGAATIGVLPLGTSNVLARELKISSIDDAVRRVVRGEARPISVGEMICGTEKRRFVLMAGVGVDGAVVEGVRLAEKRVVGKGAYVLSALRVFFGWDNDHVTVAGGGRTVDCHSVIVCNSGKYGGDLVLSPRASLFTPGFEILCINGGRFTYLKLFLLLVIGKVTSSRSVTTFTASEAEITGIKAIQCDGDFFGNAPLRLKSLPDFVRLIV